MAAIHSVGGVLYLILVVVGVLAICGGVYRAWLRDFVAAAVLILAGIIVLAVAT